MPLVLGVYVDPIASEGGWLAAMAKAVAEVASHGWWGWLAAGLPSELGRGGGLAVAGVGSDLLDE
ncbi:MAG: hypothetical protein H6668_12310 [Ardenticatenaceae bacterium]|nr:hypothetical protein [Ardenticatenaceae bacterium]